MEPNKMEDFFRKALKEREIQPSERAWDRLDAMLSVAEKEKPKHNFRWLYLAASLAVFFTVGFFLFKQQQPEISLPEQKNETVVNSELENKHGESINQSKEVVASEDKIKENSIAVTHSKGSKKSMLTEVGTQQSKEEHNSLKEELKLIDPKQDDVKTQELADLKPESVKQNTETAKVKINANSLLSSVEGELNQEFRETTLTKIKKNFKTVKTAVANRNYE